MSLSTATRDAVLEVVKRLRDPMLSVSVDSIGWEICWEFRGSMLSKLDEVRAALGVHGPGSISNWARGKSREEVAEALERIATSVHEPR